MLPPRITLHQSGESVEEYEEKKCRVRQAPEALETQQDHRRNLRKASFGRHMRLHHNGRSLKITKNSIRLPLNNHYINMILWRRFSCLHSHFLIIHKHSLYPPNGQWIISGLLSILRYLARFLSLFFKIHHNLFAPAPLKFLITDSQSSCM